MYSVLSAEFSGFVRADGYPTPFTVSIDPSTGQGQLETNAAVFPGGAGADPDPGPVCVPISAGFQVFPDGLSLNPGDSWRVLQGASYLFPRGGGESTGLQIALYMEYEHGGQGSPLTSISGTVVANGLFAVYGGISATAG